MTDNVSIVTILHGEKEFIPLILDNYQNFKDSDNLELVVVDDGKENLSSYFKEIKNCFYFYSLHSNFLDWTFFVSLVL